MPSVNINVSLNESTFSVESDFPENVIGRGGTGQQVTAQLGTCIVQMADAANISVEDIIEQVRLAVTVRETRARAMNKKGLTS